MLLQWLLALFALAQAEVILTNKISDEGEINFDTSGPTTIFPGKFWSIINNHFSSFTGALTVAKDAAFYISSDKVSLGLKINLTGRVENNGIIAFNSIQSNFPPVYNLVGVSFNNTESGKMFLGGDASAGSPTTFLTAAKWTNNGFISFYQKRRTSGTVYLGAAGGSITNNGGICFYNEDYSQQTRIYGTGCIRAQNDSAIKLHTPLYHIDTTQTFVLDSDNSQLQVAGVKPKNPFTVAGFGNGNIIGTELLVWKFKYEGDTLTLWTSPLIYVKFKIGTGYDASKFEIVNHKFGWLNLNNNAIRYNGPIPSGATSSSHCMPCEDIPAYPTSI